MPKKPIVLVLVAIAAASAYEWRYSEDMQQHIDCVNTDLQSARLNAAMSSGLLGSLQAMTAESEVGGDIIRTHEYVHTLKDEALAWKVKQAVDRSYTVGGAIQAVIAQWPESI